MARRPVGTLRESGSSDETCQAASFVGLPTHLRMSLPYLSFLPVFRVCQTSRYVRIIVRAPGKPTSTARAGNGR